VFGYYHYGMVEETKISVYLGIHLIRVYSKSFVFGLRPGSFERNPNTKSEMKKITTV
jgi:hypothetical protein